jgi:autophagy-related protein 11
LFQAPSQNLSDRADSTFSIKSPHIPDGRRGSIEGLETLVQRVHQLEAELGTEKERSAALERDLAEQTNLYNMTKAQVDEANSTKHDLLQNLEALKREFMDERKSLVDEIKRLQARLEDTEDEIEHFGESREHEKASYDETIQALRNEVERLAKEKREEALKLEGKISFLREETRTQRESIEEQERQLRVAQDEARKLSKELAALNEAGEAQQTALEKLWTRLSPEEPAPADPPNLVDRLLDKASEVLEMVRRLHGDVSVLRSQLDAAQDAVESVTADKEALAERLSSEQEISARLREALAEERAKVTALESDLADGRDQLDQLRTKLADGETGSESLRKRLQEEETKLAQVTEELASRQTQVGRLEEEVRVLQDKLHRQQNKLSSLSALFDSRSEHARDLSQRLYAQNERLAHLLERLGFSVARQGEGLAIQKIPRSERISQSTSDPDASTSLRRSGTLNGRPALFSNVDLDLLHWVNATDVEAEKEKYDAYMSSLGSFDTDAFCEVVYRRVKDIEHMARKLQRDARAYREKAHAMQKEAHEKIAFKHFKEGDLALFLPTRNQTTGAWAAFNVGFPHYFLREQEHHRLRSREWLVARISRIQERVVDLSKSLQSPSGLAKKGSGADSESVNDDENDNPFDLSDGLRWYLIDAAEDKPGAPSTPGLAKSTVAANNVEAMADRHTPGRSGSKAGGAGGRAGAGIEGVSKTLSKSLESRRSSTGSKKALPFGIGGSKGRESPAASETNSLRAVPTDAQAATSPTQQNPTQGAPPNEPPQATCEPADGGRASNGA